jgi:carbon-monoxide dehydrogenase medium subunit
MIPAAFSYRRSATLDEALQAIAGADGGSKLLAGGQSLLPLLKLRLGSAEVLVDIGRLGELKGVRQLPDGRLAVGAMTTYSELADSPARHYGLLGDAIPTIGDVQVRNRGTVGGAIAHADPSSDLAACLLALDAEIVARSVRGDRTIPVDGFFRGPFATELAADELITEVRLPGPRTDAGSAYASLEQPASGYAMVGVAAVVFIANDHSIAGATIGITGVGPHPYRATAVETGLAGADGTPSSIEAAAMHATDGIEVASDIHADRAYRTAMAAVYTRRAIEAALARLA